MNRRLTAWWRRRQRRIDRRILFPEIERKSLDREKYLTAVFCHILVDPAWKHRDEWKEEEPMLHERITFLDRVLL